MTENYSPTFSDVLRVLLALVILNLAIFVFRLYRGYQELYNAYKRLKARFGRFAPVR